MSSNIFTTTEQLRCYQLKQLRAVITKIKKNSPFYRRHLSGLKAQLPEKLADLACYPLTTAADLSANYRQMLCVSQSEISRVVTLATSGTTGTPKRIYFTAADQQLTIDFFRQGMSTLTEPGDTALLLLPGERPGSVGELLFQCLPAIGVRPLAYGLIQNVTDAIATMCRQKATCLVGNPLQVLAMARYWQQWGQSTWSPRTALLSTDYVPVAVVNELHRIWQCEVYEHYGMTEMGLGGGLECSFHQGYHLRETDLYFEIIDPVSKQTLPEGEYGEVVFTTLTRQGMPFLRYRTGDIARFIPEPCPCGNLLRRLEKIRYRKDGQIFFLKDKVTRTGLTMADLDEALLSLPGVINFNAEVIYNNKTTVPELQIILATLAADLTPAKSAIFNALKQIPAIKQALTVKALQLTAAIVLPEQLAQTTGKRSIRSTYHSNEAKL